MKALFIIVTVLVIAVVVIFFFLGQTSSSGKAIGLVDARLAKCSTKPNCVCSEYKQDADHYIDPIIVTKGSIADSKQVLKNVIKEMGGKIESETDDYIAATFTSKVFRFVDDLEIRIDTESNVIHLRSASRVGHSDISVNKQRTELFKELYHIGVSEFKK